MSLLPEIVAANIAARQMHDAATALWLATATIAEAAAFREYQRVGCYSRCAFVSAVCVCWIVKMQKMMEAKRP